MLEYKANDGKQIELRKLCKIRLKAFNETCHYIDTDAYKQALQTLLPYSRRDTFIEMPFYCDYGTNIEFGKNCYINCNCVFLDAAKIVIGNNVLIGPGVQLYTVSHPLDYRKRINDIVTTSSIVIKDNVWIGGNAIICPGVTIGTGAVIGAGSVVVKNVPDFTVYAGNPAKFIKSIDTM